MNQDLLAITTKGGYLIGKKGNIKSHCACASMLKTVEQMSRISGIGENKLRELMDSGELEYIQNGNRRLLADVAIWDWYERAKRKVAPQNQEGGK